ncbi:heme acquisition protein HasA, partial [Yersinia sp. 2542 StPb PI]
NESIKYETISSYAHQWATAYGDLVNISNIHDNYTFSDSTDMNNNRIALAEFQNPDGPAALIVGGTLLGDNGFMERGNYIQSLEFGNSFIPNADNASNTGNTPKQLDQVQLRLDGLSIDGDFYYSVCSLSRTMHAEPGKPYQGGEDEGIYNLLRGNATPMLELLKAQGIDVNTPLTDMAIATQFNAIADTPVIDTVGVTDGSDILLAA